MGLDRCYINIYLLFIICTEGAMWNQYCSAALASLLFYWSSSVAVAIVLGARGIVLVVCSFVLFSSVL